MSDGSRINVGVYVDGILVAHKDSNSSNLAWCESEMCKVFPAIHLGASSWFFGVASEQKEE